ncbi:uncharacterized protein [Aquarana catesbeiana]|uniref:uncharacterized protein n=1 Tax=Aquarana catesbeiana TaxID=8400 RepID=UPI003CC966F9
MSQAGSDDLTPAPLLPSMGSESGSEQSLLTWTISKLIAKLRCKGIPYPSKARKAELFRLLFLLTATAGPSAHQASLLSISGAISQLHSMVSSLSATVTGIKTRVAALEPTFLFCRVMMHTKLHLKVHLNIKAMEVMMLEKKDKNIMMVDLKTIKTMEIMMMAQKVQEVMIMAQKVMEIIMTAQRGMAIKAQRGMAIMMITKAREATRMSPRVTVKIRRARIMVAKNILNRVSIVSAVRKTTPLKGITCL